MDPLWILALGVTVVVGGILALRLHAFLALVLAALVVAGLTSATQLRHWADKKVTEGDWTEPAAKEFAEGVFPTRVANGFGDTCAKVGLLVALASIIGKCLLDSGAANRIVRSALRICGETRAALAFVGSGFVLGIPVFFDTVFYLMIPLAKALHLRTGRNYLLYVLAITAGGTMTHSLVPPTPGPLMVAKQLQVDLGLMILGGCLLGLVTATVGYLYALWANRRWTILLRASPDATLEQLNELSNRSDEHLPPLSLSLAPIILPVVLIAGSTILKLIWGGVPVAELAPWQSTLLRASATLGDSNLALAISATIALAAAVWHLRLDRTRMALLVQNSLLSAGEIILITGAGGAFGATLQQSGIAERLAEIEIVRQAPLIVLAFVLTTLIRTAQGSSTVAMFTAVGIVAPLVGSLDGSCHPLYLALAIGCGSKPGLWMNDSGFWVVSKMSGMTVPETLRCVTPMTSLMGLAGLVTLLIVSSIWPLV